MAEDTFGFDEVSELPYITVSSWPASFSTCHNLCLRSPICQGFSYTTNNCKFYDNFAKQVTAGSKITLFKKKAEGNY